MRVVQIAGYLGSGKTTLVLAVARELASAGKRVAILVNDVGAVPVDGRVIEEYGLAVKDIGGGCVCCQLAGSLRSTLQVLHRTQRPDVVMIEPTGVAVPGAIREAVERDAATFNVTAGPTVVLFDTTRVEKLLTYETLARLVRTQVADADLIALSKVDAAPPEAIERSRRALAAMHPGATIVELSTTTGRGLETIRRVLEEDRVSV